MKTLQAIVIGLSCALVCTAARGHGGFYGPLRVTSMPHTPQQATLIYNPSDGNLSFRCETTTALQISSASEQFLPAQAHEEALPGIFDVIQPGEIWKLEPPGFDEVDFGPVLPSNLPADFLLQDLQVDGVCYRGGGRVFLYLVPEPTGLVLPALGCLGSLVLGRRRYPRSGSTVPRSRCCAH